MKIKFSNTIKGERLVLKRTRPTLKMAEIMFKTIDINRDYLRTQLERVDWTVQVEDTLRYLFEKEQQTEKWEMVQYGIFINKEYIGNISIFDINHKAQSGEIGYWLSSSHTGNGYMTEAVRILEKEVFEKLKLNRIQIKCDERNDASIRVAKKCGYTYEGRLRERSFSNYFKDLRNVLIFSKLLSEYKQTKAST